MNKQSYIPNHRETARLSRAPRPQVRRAVVLLLGAAALALCLALPGTAAAYDADPTIFGDRGLAPVLAPVTVSGVYSREGICAAPCPPEQYPLKPPRPLAFATVWPLIVKYQKVYASHFTPEMIACVFWEESGFRLIEHPDSHALGFGQVLPANLREINARYGTNFTRLGLLTSPGQSVEAGILALEMAWDWKGQKVNALYGYAGGFQNYPAVYRWITGEPKLAGIGLTNGSGADLQNPSVQAQVVRALKACSQPGFHPEQLFE